MQAQLRWEKDGWLGDDSGQLAVALLDDTLAGIVAWRTIATGGLMAAAWRSAPCSFPSTAAKASGRPRNGCSPSTCSPAPRRTASRPSPTSRTWPSGGHWSASGSAARASAWPRLRRWPLARRRALRPAGDRLGPPRARHGPPARRSRRLRARPGAGRRRDRRHRPAHPDGVRHRRPVGSVDLWRRFTARLPRGQLEVVDGGGHLVWYDDPHRIGARVARFLAG